MKDKPRFYCGLHQHYHFAIVKPCYFGIEPKLKRQNPTLNNEATE